MTLRMVKLKTSILTYKAAPFSVAASRRYLTQSAISQQFRVYKKNFIASTRISEVIREVITIELREQLIFEKWVSYS